MLPKSPTEWYLLVVIFPMFLLGMGMLYHDIVKWREKQREMYGEMAARFPLSEMLRSIRGRFQTSIKSTDGDQTKKAA
jgi:hypothetical protein